MEYINEILKYLEEKYKLGSGFFCIYGSYATKTQKKESDIDLLFVHDTLEKKVNRTSEKYNETFISFYEISTKDLYEDSLGKYGGFFCGKIFNPKIIVEDNIHSREIIQDCIVRYFSYLLNNNICVKNKKYTDDEVLKNSIKCYIDLFPEYFAYIMRLYNSKNFAIIWNNWKKEHLESLIKGNIIKNSNRGYYYIKTIKMEKYNKIKIDYISRFWSYGSISHNSNIEFYDFYKTKNVKYIINNLDLKKRVENFLGVNYYIGDEYKK